MSLIHTEPQRQTSPVWTSDFTYYLSYKAAKYGVFFSDFT